MSLWPDRSARHCCEWLHLKKIPGSAGSYRGLLFQSVTFSTWTASLNHKRLHSRWGSYKNIYFFVRLVFPDRFTKVTRLEILVDPWKCFDYERKSRPWPQEVKVLLVSVLNLSEHFKTLKAIINHFEHDESPGCINWLTIHIWYPSLFARQIYFSTQRKLFLPFSSHLKWHRLGFSVPLYIKMYSPHKL